MEILTTSAVADPEISKPEKKGGGLEFSVSRNCFDAHSHIPHVFVVREENKILLHIVNIIY